MEHKTSLYMFAFMPPEGLANRIHSIREEFAEMFHFKKALKPPVHITLFDPFHIPLESSPEFEQYIAQIQQWASAQSPFRIDLRNYNFFSNPQHPVVYVDVIKSSPIKEFHSNFVSELAKYRLADSKSSGYKPHITIGYRDVTPAAFPEIKDYYSRHTFSSSFFCHSFYLWKHNGENWQIFKTFFLEGKEEQLSLF